MDLLPDIPLDIQLAVSLVHDSALGSSDGCIPLQLRAGLREQKIRHEERGDLLQGVEEQYTTGGGGQEARVD